MKISFLRDETVSVDDITFVVIVSRYKDKWVVVRHRERSTWEVPGGHREDHEDPQKAVKPFQQQPQRYHQLHQR